VRVNLKGSVVARDGLNLDEVSGRREQREQKK
jgi:hypothetical protein